jgi:hypothetical protein
VSDHLPDSNIRVVAVCGNEARIYSPVTVSRRFLVRVETFSNRGNAILFEQEYENRERAGRGKPQ